MKKRKNSTILTFMSCFVGIFIFMTLSYRFFSFRGKVPFSWEQIYDNWHLFLLASFLVAIVLTIRIKW